MSLALDIVIFILLFIVIPFSLGYIAVYFLTLAVMIHKADPNEYERLRRITGSTRNALKGQMTDSEDDDVHKGMAWDRERKCFVKTSSISDDALERVFGRDRTGVGE